MYIAHILYTTRTFINSSSSGTNEGKNIMKAFVRRNKTAPLPVEQTTIECENLSHNSTLNVDSIAGEKSTQTISTIFDPLYVNADHNGSRANTKLIRPYTAPERSHRAPPKMTIINMPGQVPQ